MVFCDEPLERVKPHSLYEFHDGLCGGHFVGQIIVEKILQAGYY
jgi:hypothetical protein